MRRRMNCFHASHSLGWIEGMICTAEEPPPITATVLSFKAYVLSHFAECISLPLNRSKPGMFGHFQELDSGH